MNMKLNYLFVVAIGGTNLEHIDWDAANRIYDAVFVAQTIPELTGDCSVKRMVLEDRLHVFARVLPGPQSFKAHSGDSEYTVRVSDNGGRQQLLSVATESAVLTELEHLTNAVPKVFEATSDSPQCVQRTSVTSGSGSLDMKCHL